MDIQTVKQLENGWLVNGRYTVLDTSNLASEVEEWISMGGSVEPQYTQAEIDAQAAEDAEQVVADTTRADTALKNFMGAGPAGIDSYIEANVTDITSAKAVLKILAKIVWVVARRHFK